MALIRMLNDVQCEQSTCRNGVESGIDYAIGIMSSLLRAKENADPTQTDTHCLSQRTRVVVINIDISQINIAPLPEARR
jgi:hypothetical protein